MSIMIIGEPDYTGVTHSAVTRLSDNQVCADDEALAGQTLHLCVGTRVDLSTTYDKSGSAGETQASEKTL